MGKLVNLATGNVVMTWNYRIVKCVTKIESKEKTVSHIWYGLFEVYNNKAGLPYMRTSEPIGFVGDDGEEVVSALGMAFQDALRYEILDDDDIKDENEDKYDDEDITL